MTRAFADPRFIAGLAVLSGIAALSPAPVAVRVALAAPLALVLPGWALSLAFLPDSESWLGRLPVSVATSVVLSGITGLALAATPIGLTRFVWAPLLAGVTILGAAIAYSRSPEHELSRIRLGMPGRPVLALVAAAALVMVAVTLARTPLSAGHIRGYSALWLLPTNAESDSIRIGVTNSEFTDTSYRVVLYSEGRAIFQRPLKLSAGERWSAVIDVSSIPTEHRSFDARLIKTGDPSPPYREATLVLPGSTVPPVTDVWLVPGQVDSGTMRVLVTSAEPRTERFRLELRAGRDVYKVIHPRLQPGETWSRTIDFASVPAGQRVFEARLYHAGAGAPLRQATLAPTPG
jgi:uncharacterized membrane protein